MANGSGSALLSGVAELRGVLDELGDGATTTGDGEGITVKVGVAPPLLPGTERAGGVSLILRAFRTGGMGRAATSGPRGNGGSGSSSICVDLHHDGRPRKSKG